MASSVSGNYPRFKVRVSLRISLLELRNLVKVSRSIKVLCLLVRPLTLKVILGSSSPARREILADMGYEFTVMVGWLYWNPVTLVRPLALRSSFRIVRPLVRPLTLVRHRREGDPEGGTRAAGQGLG